MTAGKLDLQPTLVGDLVVVRPVALTDWAGMYAAASDPEIWAVHPASDRYQEPVFRQFFDEAVKSESALSIVDRTSGRIVGSSRYHGFDPARNEIEIGWTFLSRNCWGGTYNREVKTLMLDHAFGFVSAVVFWVGESNIRSRRAMEKIGGVLRDGRHERTLHGKAYPHVIYEITRPTG